MKLWACSRNHWIVVVLAENAVQAEMLANAEWAANEGWEGDPWSIEEGGYGKYGNPLACVIGYT